MAWENGASRMSEPSPERPDDGEAGFLPLIKALKLYLVIDGELETRILTGKDIFNKYIHTEGYVSGIVAVGQKDIEANVDGKKISPAKPETDGTFSFGYYGDFSPNRLIDSAPENYAGSESIDMSIHEVYSHFPKVPADAISTKGRFFINLDNGEKSASIEINHNGGRSISKAGFRGKSETSFAIRYIGTQNDSVEKIVNETERRIESISAGVSAVESVFNLALISKIDILGFDDIHNAVTCAGEDKIWIYINTFKKEPINELRVIAEHEALHILVDRLNLTKDRSVRKIFADLKGFDTFSFDRFRLVSQGNISSEARRKKGNNGFFFDFISEKNFINGMKGGHPEEDLDEFCTSFLHTLMYGDRFEDNLNSGYSEVEKQMILDNYQIMLQIVADSFARYISDHERRSIDERDGVAEQLKMMVAYCQQMKAN